MGNYNQKAGRKKLLELREVKIKGMSEKKDYFQLLLVLM